jgi:hypothetical protein
MFALIEAWRKPKDQTLEKLKEQISKEMFEGSPTDEEYPQMMSMLERVAAMKARSKRPRAKPDTWIMAGAHVLGILVIVIYEQKHAWSSKAPFNGFTKLFR